VHGVAAGVVVAGDRVPCVLRLARLEHGAAHLALHGERLGLGRCGRLFEGAPDVGRPPEAVGVLVRRHVHFLLFEGEAHLASLLSALLRRRLGRHGLNHRGAVLNDSHG